VPTVEIFSLTYQYIDRLAKKGHYVPDVALAGGITLEDQMFKVLALGAPYTKLVGMARSPIAAAMVGKTIGNMIEKKKLPPTLEKHGMSIEEIFISSPELKHRFGKKYAQIPPAAIGLYTYVQRLSQGLRQLMCGARKFSLEHIRRNDIVTLTKEASQISGIQYVMDCDKEEVEKILC
jgi:glutamate synthase domain-containing protein 2